MAIFLMLRSATAQLRETNDEHVVPTKTGSRFLEVFQQTALMFAVNDKVAIHLPAATGTRFPIFASAQGRRQDLQTPV
jgi:hypothetical protein